MIFFPKEAAQLLGISVKNLHEMADDNLIPHYRTAKGWLRFNSAHISELSPTLSKSLLGVNSALSPMLSHGLTTDLTKQLTMELTSKITTELNYVRPSRIITAKYKKGEKMFNYNRNAQEALNLGSGLPWEIKGLLSILIDIMAIHDNNGIPCDPPIYICGMLSIGQRKWTTVVLPALINAHKIKRVKRGGIEVYVWHDHNLMVGPRALVQEMLMPEMPYDRTQPYGSVHNPTIEDELTRFPFTEMANDNDGKGIYTKTGDGPKVYDPPPAPGLALVPRVDVAPDIHHNPLLQDLVDRGMVKDETTVPEKEPEEVIAEALDIVAELQESHPDLMGYEIEIDAGGKTVEEFEESVMKELIPMPTAYDVLGRAGIDVENHPRGEFFWSRVEHTDVLKEWLETVPLSEIVVRIDKARIAGRLSDHMNRMEDFTDIVMGTV